MVNICGIDIGVGVGVVSIVWLFYLFNWVCLVLFSVLIDDIVCFGVVVIVINIFCNCLISMLIVWVLNILVWYFIVLLILVGLLFLLKCFVNENIKFMWVVWVLIGIGVVCRLFKFSCLIGLFC